MVQRLRQMEVQMSTNSADGGIPPGRLAAPARTSVDEVDRRIVELLRADGRMSVRTVAERAHISRANAYSRLDRLERAQVITGYRAVIDPQRYGYTVSAYVFVKLQQRSWRDFAARLAELPQVEHAAMVSGDYDGLLLVRTTDTASLRDVVLERLQSMPEVLGTQTMFILDEREARR